MIVRTANSVARVLKRMVNHFPTESLPIQIGASAPTAATFVLTTEQGKKFKVTVKPINR